MQSNSTNYRRDIHSVSFNDEGSLFVAAMDSGIRVFNVKPLVGTLRLDSSQIGSVSICKLLHRTNLIAIVGGGNRPKFADNTVLIWDNDKSKFVLEFTFATRVLNIRMRRDRMFVSEQNRIHCFTFPNQPFKLFTIETRDNPLGLFDVTCTSTSHHQLFAYPGHRVGSVQLLDLSASSLSPSGMTNVRRYQAVSTAASQLAHRGTGVRSSPTNGTVNMGNEQDPFSGTISPLDLDPPGPSVSISPSSISAHQSDIACITLSSDGKYLATASGKGTLIRVFQTVSQESSSSNAHSNMVHASHTQLSPIKVAEFRRGMDPVKLYCITFSPNSDYLLTSSDKGTVHVFALKDSTLNRRSTLSAVPLVNLSAANCTYSLAKFTLPAECAAVCTFGNEERSVYAVCVDGSFHKYRFHNDGQCEREMFDTYLDLPDSSDSLWM